MSDVFREVRVDDSNNNIRVTVHDDSVDNAEHIKDSMSVGSVIEGDFHVSVRLV